MWNHPHIQPTDLKITYQTELSLYSLTHIGDTAFLARPNLASCVWLGSNRIWTGKVYQTVNQLVRYS